MPTIEARPEQTYVGKRTILRMSELKEKVPALTAEVAKWLEEQRIPATGRPFLRYHVIDMPDRVDVAVAIPVSRLSPAMAGVEGGSLPAGRYATSTFTGIENGVPANKALIEWIAARGEEMDVHASPQGDVFASRYETVLTDTEAEPAPDRWETEIAIQVRG